MRRSPNALRRLRESAGPMSAEDGPRALAHKRVRGRTGRPHARGDKPMIRFILAALAAVLAVPAAAQAPVQAPSASYSAAKTPKVVSAAPMRLEGAVQAHRIELARPGATERAKLASLNGNRGTALSAPGMPQFIGFGRDVDAQKRRVDLSALT